MTQTSIRLSIEEMAVVLSQMGQPEQGQSLIIAQLGEMNQDEARGRLLSATHSLLAREAMTFEPDGGFLLSDALRQVGRVLTRADFTIRYTRAQTAADLQLTYHALHGRFYEHLLEQGVIHRLTEVNRPDEMIQSGLAFFEVAAAQPFESGVATIANPILETVMRATTADEARDLLRQAGMQDAVRQRFAEDLINSQFRGSALRIEYEADGSLRSDVGLLFLRGPERLWQLESEVRQGEAEWELSPATALGLRAALARLLRATQPSAVG